MEARKGKMLKTKGEFMKIFIIRCRKAKQCWETGLNSSRLTMMCKRGGDVGFKTSQE